MDSRTQCPRPDKLSFVTEDEASERYKSLLVSDLTMRVYLCRCGLWHAGRRDENVTENAIKSTPRISTGLNPAPAPAPAPARRRRRQEAPRAGAITSITVTKKVWKDAMRRADGDSSRIEVLDETNVFIHNNGNWRKRRAERSKSGA